MAKMKHTDGKIAAPQAENLEKVEVKEIGGERSNVPEIDKTVTACYQSLAKSSPTSESVDRDMDEVERKPVAEFNLYPKLPVELQLRIATLATEIPRVIKLRFANRGFHPSRLLHLACPLPSHGIPAILQVSKAWRKEALKQYKLYDIRGCRFYYNPDADIFHFGDESHVYELAYLLLTHDIKLQRLAVPDGIFIDHHLKDIAVAENPVPMGFQHPACRDLTDLYNILPSRLWRPRRSLIPAVLDQQAWFRPAVTRENFDHRQSRLPRKIQLSNGHAVEGLPTIHMVHYAPLVVGSDDRVYDSMCTQAIGQEVMDKFLSPMVENGSIQYEFVVDSYRRGTFRAGEIGFFGTKENIAKAKKNLTVAFPCLVKCLDPDELTFTARLPF